MALFPKLSRDSYAEVDRGILDYMEKFYVDSININQYYWAEADMDSRFEAGDQTAFSEYFGTYSNKKQPILNKIRPIIEVIGGHQRRNRKSTIAIPIENGDQHTADQYTKLMYWCNDNDGMLYTISDAFHGSLVTGMNLLQVWMDYRDDPISGTPRLGNRSYNTFIIDPYWRNLDLSDCNGIWTRSYLMKREVMSLLPEHKDYIEGDCGVSSRDDKFQYMPESYNYQQHDRMTYDEFYYRDYRKQTLVVDDKTGEKMEWTSDREELNNYLRTFPNVSLVENEIPTTKLAIVVNGRVLYNDINPMGIDEFPFVPVVSYYNPQLPYYYNRLQGVVRSLRDPQFLFNRFVTNIADVIESQKNSGWIYKENSVINPNSLFNNENGTVIGLKEDAQMTDVQKIPPGEASQSMFQLTQLFNDMIMQVSGVNEELMGSAVDDKAGVLAMLRQGASLTSLQRLFDNLDHSQKLVGKLLLKIIQANFVPGKVKRIIEDEPAPQFYDKAFGKYDVAIEEGLNTTTQKQMQFAQLIEIRELGVPISDEDIINNATIQGKQEIIDRMKQDKQQQQQQEQEQQQVSMQLQQAQMNLAEARAEADRGLAVERTSRVQENRALAIERLAEANKDDEMALLNKVKAVKELDEMDLANLERLIVIANSLKLEETQAAKRQQDVLQQQGLMEQLSMLQSAGNQQQPGASMEPVQQTEEPPVIE